jgi:hypothetical protein
MEEIQKKESGKPAPTKNWRSIPEIRMVLYVVPVGTALALIGLILSQISYR